MNARVQRQKRGTLTACCRSHHICCVRVYVPSCRLLQNLLCASRPPALPAVTPLVFEPLPVRIQWSEIQCNILHCCYRTFSFCVVLANSSGRDSTLLLWKQGQAQLCACKQFRSGQYTAVMETGAGTALCLQTVEVGTGHCSYGNWGRHSMVLANSIANCCREYEGKVNTVQYSTMR